MRRSLLVAVLFLFAAVGVARAGEFQALLIWVDVKEKKIDVIKIEKAKRDDAHSATLKALLEGEEITLAADGAKVFTSKDKGLAKEFTENPAGLDAIKLIHRVNRKTTVTTRIVEITTDDKTGKVTSIKAVSAFVREKAKN